MIAGLRAVGECTFPEETAQCGSGGDIDLRGNVHDRKAGGPLGSPVMDRCSEAVGVCHWLFA